jgi:hypothetical protein
MPMNGVDLDLIEALLIRLFLVVTLLSTGLHVTGRSDPRADP